MTGAAADKASPSPLSTDDWSLNVSPYIWGSSLEGSIAPFPGAPEADVDVSFSDILKHLDLAGMVIVDLRYQRFAGYMDLIYTDVSTDQDTPLGILFNDVDLESEVFIGTVGGAYRPIETGHASLDLLVGVRVWSVDTDLKLRGGLLPDQDFEHSENWADPVIGVHGLYQFDNGIFLTTWPKSVVSEPLPISRGTHSGPLATSSTSPFRQLPGIATWKSITTTTALPSTSSSPDRSSA